MGAVASVPGSTAAWCSASCFSLSDRRVCPLAACATDPQAAACKAFEISTVPVCFCHALLEAKKKELGLFDALLSVQLAEPQLCRNFVAQQIGLGRLTVVLVVASINIMFTLLITWLSEYEYHSSHSDKLFAISWKVGRPPPPPFACPPSLPPSLAPSLLRSLLPQSTHPRDSPTRLCPPGLHGALHQHGAGHPRCALRRLVLRPAHQVGGCEPVLGPHELWALLWDPQGLRHAVVRPTPSLLVPAYVSR